MMFRYLRIREACEPWNSASEDGSEQRAGEREAVWTGDELAGGGDVPGPCAPGEPETGMVVVLDVWLDKPLPGDHQ